jgi:hypothetical protein
VVLGVVVEPVGGTFVPPGTQGAATVGLVRVALLVELVLELIVGFELMVDVVEAVPGFDVVVELMPVVLEPEVAPVVPTLVELVVLVLQGPATVGLTLGVVVVVPVGVVVVPGI